VDGLAALADATRRAIFEHLVRRGPLAVGEIAAAFPVSRPAVSQHLKALVDAGLVTASSAGTRRVYTVNPEGVSALHRWIDTRWQQVLDTFERAARNEGAVMSVVPPVRKTRTVPSPWRRRSTCSRPASANGGRPRRTRSTSTM
jgi:DNA-binding transcriptional ArsR family regulator